VNSEQLGSYRIEQDFYFSEATPLTIWLGPVPIICVAGSGELVLDDATATIEPWRARSSELLRH